jgi:hypothetical protein
MENPVDVYFNHLGSLQYFKRCPIAGIKTDGLNYMPRNGMLSFYNKIKE